MLSIPVERRGLRVGMAVRLILYWEWLLLLPLGEAAGLTGEWKPKLGRTVCINGAHDGPELARYGSVRNRLTMRHAGCLAANYASFIGSFRAGSVIASILTA